jgi:hypothetical protein
MNELLPLSLVENDEVDEVFVVEADGRTARLARTESAVLIDEHGGRHFVERRYVTRTDDGRLLHDPTVTLVGCRCGKQLLTTASVVFCAHCAQPCCKAHAHEVPEYGENARFCDACWDAVRRKLTWGRVWAWLTDLG